MTDFYPVYNICGRVLDMTALNDQHYGGLIIWLPGTLTSFAAMIVVLVTMRLNEERIERERAAATQRPLPLFEAPQSSHGKYRHASGNSADDNPRRARRRGRARSG